MKTAWIVLVLSLMAVSCSSIPKGNDHLSEFPKFHANERR